MYDFVFTESQFSRIMVDGRAI